MVGACQLERQPQWATYRIDNVPRTVRTLGGVGPVQGSTLIESILIAIGQQPLQVAETAQSKEKGLCNSSWFASFNANSYTPFPKSLYILGIIAYAMLVIYKPKIMQYIKCF